MARQAGAWQMMAGVLMLALTLPTQAFAGTPLDWSEPQPIDSGHSLYGGVSCPTSTFCAAADDAGNVVTTTDPAGNWSIANVGGSTSFAGIACPSASLCVAVDQTGNVVSSANPTGGAAAWNSAFVDLGPIDEVGEDFAGIACPSASLCVAVDTAGNVFTSTNPTGNASAWQMTNVDGTTSLESISCPSPSFCVITDEQGNVITSTNPTGGAAAWNVTHLDGIGFPESLREVACPSVSLCLIGDETEDVITSTNPTGGASAWSLAPVGLGIILDAACPSMSLCFLGYDSGRILSSSNPTGGVNAWTLTQTGSTEPIRGIACPSVSFCVGVDDDGNALIGTPSSEGGSGGSSGGEGQISASTSFLQTAPMSSPKARKKPVKCRRGFKKRKVHDKARCLKVRRHQRGAANSLAELVTSGPEQECLAAGLARPRTLNPPAMYRAGIRPFTPHRHGSQTIWGMFLYSDMTACSSQFRRVARGQVQMQKRGERRVWINNGWNQNPFYLVNLEGRAQLTYGPNHAWPDYLFNECEDGRGWLKVRIVMTSMVKDSQTHQVLAEDHYVIPVPVHGRCQAARFSKEATKNIKEEWEGGSGS